MRYIFTPEGWHGLRSHLFGRISCLCLTLCTFFLQEVFLTPEYICIAMEYASSGNLFSYVKQAVRLKEAASRCVFGSRGGGK